MRMYCIVRVMCTVGHVVCVVCAVRDPAYSDKTNVLVPKNVTGAVAN